jgi:hypothetical protein
MTYTISEPHALIQQKHSLLQELEISIYAIECGLSILQGDFAYSPKPKHFAYLLMLATGFERLMKVILCIHNFHASNKFPSEEELRLLGHKLIDLRDKVINQCFSKKYLERPSASEDLEFLTKNGVIVEMLELLDDFARGDRYFFMDRIANPTIGREWPNLRWEQIEIKAVGKENFTRLFVNHQELEFKQRATKELIIHIERFVRAFARLFIFSDLGELASTSSGVIWDFMRLEDSELGKRVYKI